MGEWQPIETAPKDGSKVLTARGDGDKCRAVISWWNEDKYAKDPRPYWECHEQRYLGVWWARTNPPTHWMPLPPPPKEAADDVRQ